MAELLSQAHELTLLTPRPAAGLPPPPADAPYRVETYEIRRGAGFVAGFGRALGRRLPLQSALFYQPDLGRRLRELAPAADLGILQLVRLALHLEDFGGTPLLVDLIDSLSLSFARRAAVDRPWRRPFLRFEARLLARGERRLAERAARVLVVCERDRQSLTEALPPELAAKVVVAPLAPPERRPEAPSPERSDGAGPLLAMTGNLGYFVNADSVTWWLAEVWPTLRRARPDVRVVVAGDRPGAAVRHAVAAAGARLIESPPDLRAVLAEATVALAPMRCGAGVPVKILEAWSAGLPVVASRWAAAGTSGRPEEDFRVVGQQPSEWVEAILDLLDRPAERQRLADAGRRRLASDYSLAEVGRRLEDTVLKAISPN